MSTVNFNKLVRDQIPKIIADKNLQARYEYIGDDEEFHHLLVTKLLEECIEFGQCSSDEELADVLEVIAALRQFHPQVDEKRKQKFADRGGFEKRILLVSMEDDK